MAVSEAVVLVAVLEAVVLVAAGLEEELAALVSVTVAEMLVISPADTAVPQVTVVIRAAMEADRVVWAVDSVALAEDSVAEDSAAEVLETSELISMDY